MRFYRLKQNSFVAPKGTIFYQKEFTNSGIPILDPIGASDVQFCDEVIVSAESFKTEWFEEIFPIFTLDTKVFPLKEGEIKKVVESQGNQS